MSRVRRTLAAPVLRHLGGPVSRLTGRAHTSTELAAGSLALERHAALARVDVSAHNRGTTPPGFDRLVSQVISAAQFDHPDFQRLAQLVTGTADALPWSRAAWPPGQLERKLWEWCYILKAAEQHGKMARGVLAVGFGVGGEPVPAVLAQSGVSVLATDRAAEQSGVWAESGQHLEGLASLSRPDIVSDDELAERVRIRYVDMNDVPEDLGTFDLLWSSCAIEHLGSPEAGLGFVLRTLDLLRPGGVAVHTTELELTPRSTTADYGNLAIYRVEDLNDLREAVQARGCEMETNWYVALETTEDRWIGLPPYRGPSEPFHLKLVINDSITTSVGLLISKPA